MGQVGLEPWTDDYECDASPHGRFAIGCFVRSSLTLADSAEGRFSLLCATNVPLDVGGDADGLTDLGSRQGLDNDFAPTGRAVGEVVDRVSGKALSSL